MRHVLTAAFVASFAVSVAAQGQQPAGQQPATPAERPTTQGERPTTPGQQPTTRAESPATTQAAKVMIAGCIQAAPPAPAAGGAPAAPAASKFDLANAKVVSSGPVGTTGTAPTAMRYRLEGDEKTISPHLNHQVEITGTVSPATAAGAAGTTTATPMLKVESVKMVAATCPSAAPETTPNR
jgi:hypothetical protein